MFSCEYPPRVFNAHFGIQVTPRVVYPGINFKAYERANGGEEDEDESGEEKEDEPSMEDWSDWGGLSGEGTRKRGVAGGSAAGAVDLGWRF